MRIAIISLALITAALAISPGDIIVNEIMYNGPESGTDNEWTELYNTTSSDIVLDSTFELTDGEGSYYFEGITISAEGYLTIKVAENDVEPFPFTPDVDASEYGIAFSNSSDQVILIEGSTTIDEVDYDDDWGADGDGPSLERIDPSGPSMVGENWGPSTPDGGTPGEENSIYDPGGDFPPSITDIMHTPEYPTPTDEVAVTAEITDEGTITKAMCFFSIDDGPEDSLNMFDDGLHGDLGADDDIWGAMIDPQPAGSNVRYFLVVEDDGAHSETTWTYAYFVTTGDTIDGDLIVNEIMYNPGSPMSDSDYEFVELYNRSASMIDASEWILKDDNDFNSYTIPAGTEVGAGEYLVISVNPDSVMSYYGISGVLGPMGFNLNNSGDAVRLYNSEGTLMDFVYFSNEDPWPTEPNGDGPSLSLIDPMADNNESTNWEPSSGVGTPGALNTSVEELGARPAELAILQLSPNPFNAAVRVHFKAPDNCEAKINIYDINGRMVGNYLNRPVTSGAHSLNIEMTDQPAGIYLVELDYGSGKISKKALLVK